MRYQTSYSEKSHRTPERSWLNISSDSPQCFITMNKEPKKMPPPRTRGQCKDKSSQKYPVHRSWLWLCINQTPFKGTMSQDFMLLVFSWISFPPTPEYSIRTVSNFFENSFLAVMEHLFKMSLEKRKIDQHGQTLRGCIFWHIEMHDIWINDSWDV